MIDKSELKEEYEQGYKDGYIDCLHNYAIYRDGVQYIGVR